jgi:transposase
VALTYMLTLDDPHRFSQEPRRGLLCRTAAGTAKLWSQPTPTAHQQRRRRISSSLLVQSAHHILGRFGEDSDLRLWGLKLAERGGKNGKKRAIVATARKLAVLLHRLWVSGEVYEPFHSSNRGALVAAA